VDLEADSLEKLKDAFRAAHRKRHRAGYRDFDLFKGSSLLESVSELREGDILHLSRRRRGGKLSTGAADFAKVTGSPTSLDDSGHRQEPGESGLGSTSEGSDAALHVSSEGAEAHVNLEPSEEDHEPDPTSPFFTSDLLFALERCRRGPEDASGAVGAAGAAPRSGGDAVVGENSGSPSSPGRSRGLATAETAGKLAAPAQPEPERDAERERARERCQAREVRLLTALLADAPPGEAGRRRLLVDTLSESEQRELLELAPTTCVPLEDSSEDGETSREAGAEKGAASGAAEAIPAEGAPAKNVDGSNALKTAAQDKNWASSESEALPVREVTSKWVALVRHLYTRYPRSPGVMRMAACDATLRRKLIERDFATQTEMRALFFEEDSGSRTEAVSEDAWHTRVEKQY